MLFFAGVAGVSIMQTMKDISGSIGEKPESQLREEQQFLGKSYAKANKEFKEKQIELLLRDFRLGLLTEQQLREKAQKVELTDLDVDKYAKKHLSEEQLKKYSKIKEEAEYSEDVRISFDLAALYVCLMAFVVCAPGLIYLGIKKVKEMQENKTQALELEY